MAKDIYPENVKKIVIADLTGLQDNLGYHFNELQYLRTAVTHSSAISHYADRENEARGKYYYYYEQLEFVGDRVLGLVISRMLYDMFPTEPEGHWAKRHTGAVREETLAMVAEKLDLGDYLLLSSGEQRSGGRKKQALLADAMEAVIAAIYLDASFARAEEFIKTQWADIINKYEEPPEDPKTQLQEWAQAQGKELPIYKIIEKSGPDHAPIFEISVGIEGLDIVSAKESSKRRAEKKAAETLLEIIKND